MKRKLLSCLLAVVMLIGLVPSAVFAEEVAVASIGETTYNTLQAAIDAAVNGDTITLLADCAKNVTVPQKPDFKITIDGNGKTYTGVIVVDGNSGTYLTAGLTIKNVNFDATGISKDASINMGDGSTGTRYVCNLTVQNCTFTDDDNSAVAVKTYTGGDKNLTITDCTVTGMHSLAQLQSNVTGVIITGCTVTAKNGINLNHSSDILIDNNFFDVDDTEGYAIRFGASSGNAEVNATVSNNTIIASETESPIIIRKSINAASEIVLKNNNVTIICKDLELVDNQTDTEVAEEGNVLTLVHNFVDGICTRCGEEEPVEEEPEVEDPKFLMFFPRLFPVTVTVEEGAKVNTTAKFVIAFGANRTIRITVEEGYEVTDIIVNGKSVGAADSYTLKGVVKAQDVVIKTAAVAAEETAE